MQPNCFIAEMRFMADGENPNVIDTAFVGPFWDYAAALSWINRRLPYGVIGWNVRPAYSPLAVGRDVSKADICCERRSGPDHADYATLQCHGS